MTIHSPRDFREIISQQEAFDRILAGKNFEQQYFTDPLLLTTLMVKRTLNIHECYLRSGLTLEGGRLAHDMSFERSLIAGECYFKSLTVARVLDLTKIGVRNAFWSFKDISVAKTDNADILISFQEDSRVPQLDTNNEIILEMFARLAFCPTEVVGYREIQDEFK